MKKVIFLLMALLLISIPLFAEVSVSTLYLYGKVGHRNFLTVVQGDGGDATNAIPLDSGLITLDEPGIGLSVGTWSVEANSMADLYLHVEYGPFSATINNETHNIPYVVNNGSAQIESGQNFIDLVRINETYHESDNSGEIYIKRTDDIVYPPSSAYVTTITLILATY